MEQKSLFIPGRLLSQRFYWEVVQPLLVQYFPDVPHAAGLLGAGSDVLGFDTEMSMDHDWGPAVTLLVREEDAARIVDIDEVMRVHLPRTFVGLPVGMIESPEEKGTYVADRGQQSERLIHRVRVTTTRQLCVEMLGYDLLEPLGVVDWLTLATQHLRCMTDGVVHHDGVRELTELRRRLAWYPHDVWLYLLAAGWRRIAQEEHLMPRAGYVGDELGSALIGSRLVRDIMALCFLMERQYAPYPKWFGTGFKRLACAEELALVLWRAQVAETWQERQVALGEAYEQLARMHNRLGITEIMEERVTPFFGRPFQVIWGDTFADAIVERITDEEVKRIAGMKLIGGIDQFSDSTDLRADVSWREGLKRLYGK